MSARLLSNVFRLDGFAEVTWMRLVCRPSSDQAMPLTREQKVRALASAHIWLQDAGHLSAWGWTPATHVQEGELSLWLFFPKGVHFTIPAEISNLSLAEVGQWQCNDGEESLGVLLFQALGAHVQRMLVKAGYVQFGHMLVKCRASSMNMAPMACPSLPSVELHFVASNSAVYVAALCSRRHVRRLVEGDIQQCSGGGGMQEVLVAPYGWIGALRRRCSSELVKRLRSAEGSSWENGVLSGDLKAFDLDHEALFVEVQILQSSSSETPAGHCTASAEHHSLDGKVVIVPQERVLRPLWPPPPSSNSNARMQSSRRGQEEWSNAYLSSLFRALRRSWVEARADMCGPLQTMQAVKNLLEGRAAVSSAAGSSAAASVHSKGNSNSSGSNSLDEEEGEGEGEGEGEVEVEGEGNGEGQVEDSHRDERSKRPLDSVLLPIGKRSRSLPPRTPTEGTFATEGMGKYRHGGGSPGCSEEPSSLPPFRQWRSFPDGPWSFPHQLSPFEVGGPEVDDVDILADYGGLSEVFEDDGLGLGELPDAQEAQALLLPSAAGAAAHSLTEKIRHSRAEARIERLELATQAEAEALCASGYGAVSELSHRDFPSRGSMSFQYNPPSNSSSVLDTERMGAIGKSDYGPDPPSLRNAACENTEDVARMHQPENKASTKRIVVDSGGVVSASPIAEEAGASAGRKILKNSNHKEPKKTIGRTNPLLAGTPFESLVLQMSAGWGPHDSLEQHCVCKGGAIVAKSGSGSKDVSSRERIPSRIAGDDTAYDSPGTAPTGLVGVWRSVETQQQGGVAAGNGPLQGPLMPGVEQEAIPLLLQQLTPSSDMALEKALSLLESQRCVNCGAPMRSIQSGKPAETSLWAAQPLNLLLAPMSASSASAVLKFDVSPALISAFGVENVQGPLTASEWCHGSAAPSFPEVSCPHVVDPIADGMEGEAEPITPPQGGYTGASSGRGAGEGGFADSPLPENADEGESGELGSNQSSNGGLPFDELALAALSGPSILVGYQEDWLATSPAILALWDKAPLEPYSSPKPVLYYALCPQEERVLQGAANFFHELGTVYEACRLGTHSPATLEVGDSQVWSGPGSSFPGLVQVAMPPSDWSIDAYVEAIRKACATFEVLPPTGSNVTTCDGDFEPCVVVYVVCPWNDPTSILRLLAASAAILGASAGIRGLEEPRNTDTLCLKSSIALQLIPLQLLLPGSRPTLHPQLREMAFSVYTKARRTALGSHSPPEPTPSRLSSLPPLSTGAQWKDCSNRSEAAGSATKSPSEGLGTGWLYEPLFVLSRPCQLQRGIGEGGDANGSPSPPEFAADGGGGSALHCCYTWGGGSPSHRSLLCVWTDSRGELLEVEVLSGADQGGSLQRCFTSLLTKGLQLIRLAGSSVPSRRIVIMRLGTMPYQETRDWHFVLRSRSFEDRGGLVCVLPPPGETGQQEGRKVDGRRNIPTSEGNQFLGLAASSPAQTLPSYGSGKQAQWQGVAAVTIGWIQTESGLQLLSDSPSLIGGGFGALGQKWSGSNGAAIVVVPLHVPRQFSCGEDLQGDSSTQPLSSAFLVTPKHGSLQTDQPSVLSISLALHYMPAGEVGGEEGVTAGQSAVGGGGSLGRQIVQTVAAELHGLSWLSLTHDGRRVSSAPMHCRLAQRLQGLFEHFRHSAA